MNSPAPVELAGTADALERVLPGAVRRDRPLGARTTYRAGGLCAIEVTLNDRDQVARASEVLADDPVPVLVLGRGSNLLVADAGFPGIAVVPAGRLDEVEVRPGADQAHAGGAAALPVLARRTAHAGCSGLEFYVGIPGSVGGAVRMNAGGHGRATDEVLVRAEVAHFGPDGEPGLRSCDAADLDFGYRHSALGPRDLVVRATYRVGRDDVAACEARVTDIVRWRREHQPGGANAGSVFRNPAGDSAGRLVEAAGLKGRRVGGAVVSTKHANFIQAEEGTTAQDVWDLAVEVRRVVWERTGVALAVELHTIGFPEWPGLDGL